MRPDIGSSEQKESSTASEIGPSPAVEFPRAMLPLLRCCRDAGELVLAQERRGAPSGVVDGTLRCASCFSEYPIESGIACLMTEAVTQEDAHEMALLDEKYRSMPANFVAPSDGWRSEFNDLIEVPPHLNAVKPLEGRRVLELACGDGRFTVLMAQLGAEVLAVDFAIQGLRKLAANLVSGKAPTTYRGVTPIRQGSLVGCVGLVHADASHLRLAPRSFDRALSATPLDSRDERMEMYRTIAEALKDDGHFVGGVEHDDLLRRVMGMPVARRYSPGGVFIEHFSIRMMRREAAPFFERLRIRPIRAHVPFIKRLPARLAASIALAACAIPGLRQLGTILLMRAERPIRAAVEGSKRTGSNAAKELYRWYKRRRGEEPQWDLVDRV